MKKSKNILNNSAIRAHASELCTVWVHAQEDNENVQINRTAYRGATNKKTLSQSEWYRIVIPSGNRYHMDYFLTELRRAIYPQTFTPYFWRLEGWRASFYVDDFKAASAIAGVSNKIVQPNGHPMEIILNNSEPRYQLNENLREKMVKAMQKRYDSATNALDLTKFWADENLRHDYCPLSRPIIMLAAIDLIAGRVPHLEELSLNNNNMMTLYHMNELGKKLPHLKILHLANNRITDTASLSFIRNSNIVEIDLKGNPFRNYFEGDISTIRARFPKIRKVDDIVVPQQIGFDIQTDNFRLPPPQYTFFADPNGAEIVKQFLETYYTIYDSDNRQPLEQAYHDQALLSLTASKYELPAYRPFSRNLNSLNSVSAKVSQLKNGKEDIVSFLSTLPATKHDPQSFSVDLMIYTEKLILLTVTGIFCEEDDNETFSLDQKFMRSFNRTFAVTKISNGVYCIINDMLHVNRLTRDQEKMVFKGADSAPATSTRLTANATQVHFDDLAISNAHKME